MAQKGAVGYLFESKGLIYFEKSDHEEHIVDLAIDAGAEDVDVKEDGDIEIVVPVSVLESLRDIYEKQEYVYQTATVTKLASTLAPIFPLPTFLISTDPNKFVKIRPNGIEPRR